MVVIRATQKLLRRIGPTGAAGSVSTTRLGDWTGNLLGVRHRRVVLFISERSRLPVVLPARDLEHVAQQLPLAVGAVLEALGIPADAIRAEQRAMTESVIAPTNSRSLIGTLNDLGYGLKLRLAEEPDASLIALGLWLSETPIGPMKYQKPAGVTRRLFTE